MNQNYQQQQQQQQQNSSFRSQNQNPSGDNFPQNYLQYQSPYQSQSVQPPIRIQDQDLKDPPYLSNNNKNSNQIPQNNMLSQHHQNQQQQQHQSNIQVTSNSQHNGYIDEYGTDGMEYTPSLSSNRNTAAGGNNNTSNDQHQHQLSSQQQQINYQLTDPSAQSSIYGGSAQQVKSSGVSSLTKQGFNVNQFEAATLQNEDPTDQILNQQFMRLQQEQQQPVNRSASNSSRGVLISSGQHPDRMSILNPSANDNQNLNLSLNGNNVGVMQNYSSNKSERNIPTPGFQSLNNSAAVGSEMPLQQSNLVEQLSLKVKSQAERLQFLENYKTLCERKIRDFDSSHPLPILPSHIGQRSATSTNGAGSGSGSQLDSALHQKVQELQGQVINQSELKIRLSQAEESLRRETLQNEEQRAYIRVLREQLESKLTQVGLILKNNAQHQTGFDSNVDGYLHLINLQKQVSELSRENQRLLSQLQDQALHQEQSEKAMLSQFKLNIDDLKTQHQQQLQQVQDKLTANKARRKQLKQDKNQLLDFVEESLQKQQAEERLKNELVEDQKRKESIISQLQKQLEDLKKEKQHQDDLIHQVQQNLRAMRDEKEKLQSQLDQVSMHRDRLESLCNDDSERIKSLEEQIGSVRRVANDLDRQLGERVIEVKRLETDVSRKEREIESLIKGQQEITKEKSSLIDIIRLQLDDQTQKNYALEDSNINLSKTLQATQQELDSLIKQYELLSKSNKIQTSEFLALKKQLSDTLQELEQRTRTYNEIKAKDDTLEKELQEVYHTLGSKNSYVKDQEQRMNRTLQDKDEEFSKMVNKYEQLLAQSKDQTQRMELLERIRDDKDRECEKLKHTVELKKNVIDDLQQQMIRTKADFENQYLTTQRTLNLAQTDLERKDQEYRDKLSRTTEELTRIKEQRFLAEKVLGENVEKNRQLEIERIKLEEKLKRLEQDIGKLENNQGREKQKKEQIQDEVERFRGQRVDDAMLIEKLRGSVDQVKSGLNELVGVISSFQPYLDQLVSTDAQAIDLATKELTALYEQIGNLKILKSDQDLPESLSQLKECIHTFIVYTKSINRFNQQNTMNFYKTQGNMTLNGRERDQVDNNFRLESIAHSPPQKESWNVPQRINNLAYQNIYLNPNTNVSQIDVNPDQSMIGEDNGYGQLNQDTLKLQATHQNLKQLHDQLQQEQNKHSQVKSKLDLLEQQSALDKQHIEDLESLMRRLLQQESLEHKMRRVMTDLFENARDLINLRYEKTNTTKQLMSKEQRYHTLNKAGVQGMTTYAREISLLKGSIERERQTVKELDVRVDEHLRRQIVLFEELHSLDQILANKEYDKDIVSHGLQQENDELKKVLAKTQQDKEWAERRFIELEDQLNRFNMPLSLSRIDQKSEKDDKILGGELSPHSADQKNTDSRLYKQQLPQRRENSHQNETNNYIIQHDLNQSVVERDYKQQYSAQNPQQFKRNASNSDRKQLPQDSYSLDHFAEKQTSAIGVRGSERNAQASGSLVNQYRTVNSQNRQQNSNQLISQFEPKSDFNIHRSFQNNHYNPSQEQSIQLPPPGQIYVSRGNNQGRTQLQNEYEYYENNMNNNNDNANNSSAQILRKNNPPQNASQGSGLHFQSQGAQSDIYGDQQTSANVLRNKIQQVKTMFSQIRQNIN